MWRNLKLFLLLYPVHSQIWLNFIMDDRRFSYITNMRGKNPAQCWASFPCSREKVPWEHPWELVENTVDSIFCSIFRHSGAWRFGERERIKFGNFVSLLSLLSSVSRSVAARGKKKAKNASGKQTKTPFWCCNWAWDFLRIKRKTSKLILRLSMMLLFWLFRWEGIWRDLRSFG